MYEHNALGYRWTLALCLTKVRSSRARCPATILIMGGFQKNEVFFNIKAGLISFIHIRSHLYLKCVLSRCQTP